MREKGFSLLELLAVASILGLLTVLGASAIIGAERGYRLKREQALLHEEVGLLAETLEREMRLSGYRTPQGGLQVEVGEREEDRLTLRYFCDGALDVICGSGGLGLVRTSVYEPSGGNLLWGGCLVERNCPPSMGIRIRGRLERFRVAYQSAGTWRRGTVSLGRGDTVADRMAVYLRLVGEARGRTSPFVPGEGAGWEPGLTLEAFGLEGSVANDGRVRVERVVVVPTPNLAPLP